MTTQIMKLPEIAQAQAGKWITHNAALNLLDAYVAVKSRTNGGPPASPIPVSGDRYIVDSATGDWSGFSVDDLVVYYLDSSANPAWLGVTPEEGITTYVQDEDIHVTFNASAWQLHAAAQTIISTAATTYTLSLSDALAVIRFTSGSGITVTIPLHASVPFPTGTIVSIRQAGSGSITVALEGSPIQITVNGTAAPSAQHDEVALRKIDANEWDVIA